MSQVGASPLEATGPGDVVLPAAPAAGGRRPAAGRVFWRWLRANGVAIAVYLALLVAWEAANRVFRVPEYLVPPPSAVLQRLAENPARLLAHSLTTLQEVLGGFALGVAVSLPLALLIAHSRLLGRLIYPLLVAFQAIPKVALAPLLVVWFGFGPTSKVVLGLVTAMFPMVVNTVVGLRQTPPEMIHLMRSLGASPLQTFTKVRLFAAAPSIFAGLKVGITLAVVGAVVGEFIASNGGLGYLLLVANNSFNTPLLFAVIVVLSLMSVALFSLIEAAEVLVLPRPLRRKETGIGRGGRA